VIDLTNVQFLASKGLSVLLEAERAGGESDQLLRVVAAEHRAVARSRYPASPITSRCAAAWKPHFERPNNTLDPGIRTAP
jgi:hypothetical protein